jgi:hypothetical protein
MAIEYHDCAPDVPHFTNRLILIDIFERCFCTICHHSFREKMPPPRVARANGKSGDDSYA